MKPLLLIVALFLTGCMEYKTTIHNKAAFMCELNNSELLELQYTVSRTVKKRLSRYNVTLMCSDGEQDTFEIYLYSNGELYQLDGNNP